MDEPERPTCRTCPHWLALDPSAHTDESGWGMAGECLRSPMRPVYAIQDGTGKLVLSWRQPDAEWFDSCGEHPDFPAFARAFRAWQDGEDA